MKYNTFAVYTYGRVEIYFQHLAKRPAFEDESKRLELCDRLNEIDGVAIPVDALTRRPSILLETLASTENQAKFLKVLDWIAAEIRTTAAPNLR